jgi:predicted secreted Zn-dependent protease
MPTNTPPALKKAWNRYLTALEQHEAGHAQLALDAVAEQHKRVTQLGGASDCSALKKRIYELAGRIVDDYRKRDKEYDERTAHGVRQGALLSREREEATERGSKQFNP